MKPLNRILAVFPALVLLLGIAFAGEATAQPQELWRIKPPLGYIDTSPAVGDLDRDGMPDMVLASTEGLVWAVDGNGNDIWRTETDETITCPPTITGNAKDCVVLVVANSGTVFCLEGSTGAEQWRYTLPAEVKWGTTSIAAADLTGEGAVEYLVGDSGGTLICLDSNGKVRWSQSLACGFIASPAVADLEGDGSTEILIGGGETALICLDAHGEELWRVDSIPAAGSGPAPCDLDKDGTLEILVGIETGLAAISSTGKVLWTVAAEKGVDSSIAAVHLDDDGKIDILAVDLAGALHCVSAEGAVQWTANVEKRVRRTPAVADLDGDGVVEIIVGGYAGKLFLFTPAGEVKEQIALFGHTNAAPLVIDLNGDGRLSLVSPQTLGGVSAWQWPTQSNTATVLWAEYRGNSQRTGSGDVTAVQTRNRQGMAGNTKSQKSLRTAIQHELDLLNELGEELSGVPGAQHPCERVELERYRAQGIVAATRRILKQSTPTTRELRALQHVIAQAAKSSTRILRMLHAALYAENTVLLYAANPWAPFGGTEELMEGRVTEARLKVEAFQGETESVALNVFNCSNVSRTFRVTLDDLSNPGDATPLRAVDVLTTHEVLEVPTMKVNYAADALPRLNQAQTFTVPPWNARQLWFNVNTQRLSPGQWATHVTLKSLDPTPVQVTAPIEITVWESVTPSAPLLRHCNWGYVERSALRNHVEESYKDMSAHGTNVFVSSATPYGTFDADGELVGDVDYAKHDEYMKQYPADSLVLFHSCFSAGVLKGPAPYRSEIWDNAFKALLQDWVKHLAEKGVGYGNFALYPVDEPGLRPGLVEKFIDWAKLADAADPKIRMYTDPTAGAKLEELQRMNEYVDIWCPNRDAYMLSAAKEIEGHVRQCGTPLDCDTGERLAYLKTTGKELWTYACDTNAKHQSSLGYYRGQAWFMWHHGFTGTGFWTYCTSNEDGWYFPDKSYMEYMMIYPAEGPVSSKRWEAVRDGSEDFSMLYALKTRSDAAERQGRHPDAIAKARILLEDTASEIATFCDEDTLDTRTWPEARKLADERWHTLQETRRNIAEVLAILSN